MQKVQDSKCKEGTMKRIYFIYYCRKSFGNFALKIYLSLALLWVLIFNVSLTDIFRNTRNLGSPNFDNLWYFYKYAFFNTELIVQTTLGLAVLFGLFILSRNLRNVSFLTKGA